MKQGPADLAWAGWRGEEDGFISEAAAGSWRAGIC